MLSKKKIRIMLAVIAIVMIALIGGNRMAIIKEVGQIRESIAQKFPSEEEKRRRIALWVVQHFEGPEPIRKVEVGEIYSYGILGTGGRSSSAIINGNSKNIIESISVDKTGMPTGNVVYDLEMKYKFKDKADKNKTLKNVEVRYWKGRK
ncbi:hypothetical protein [Lactobacillus taiwanensis]|uniref:hypothetical protein n=1 Tax=Lactobacillus taiwanensis TaxID=508451 RepID=UPI0025A9FDE5|nr:hypothetical protein [Lactobacillus taiwanensis]